ncbi:MAG: hypothetical protein GY809_03400, partial [Planctomycetes bacterium]|nr:hypothetical protein [Planctomycetota bacterium]
GNVRELENCMERGVVLSPGTVLSPDFLPVEVTQHSQGLASGGHQDWDETEISRLIQQICERAGDLAKAKEAIHRTADETILRYALAQKKSQRKIAEVLGMSRMTLRKKIREYGLG